MASGAVAVSTRPSGPAAGPTAGVRSSTGRVARGRSVELRAVTAMYLVSERGRETGVEERDALQWSSAPVSTGTIGSTSGKSQKRAPSRDALGGRASETMAALPESMTAHADTMAAVATAMAAPPEAWLQATASWLHPRRP
ncbi:hypothetical protein BE11_01285 [Sorangium cellulosum]|nr:hypothetical protein BE11_01285 [Sorangium cellulosum]